jgi:hypothetical protein
MTEHDLHEDDALKAALRAHTPAPPFDEVDWNELHALITAGAAPLARRRSATWWRLLAGWSPRGVPVAAAAAALVVLLLGGVVRPAPPELTAYDGYRIIEEELADALLEDAVPLFGSGSDAVVDALLFQEVDE